MDKLEKIFDDKTFQDPEYYGANFSFPEVSKKEKVVCQQNYREMVKWGTDHLCPFQNENLKPTNAF